MPSQTENILQALKILLDTHTPARVERNLAEAEKISPDGLIILRDGHPGEPEYALGGFGSVYYAHEIALEIYVEDGVQATRDMKFDALLGDIGTALQSDPTLGGLCFGLRTGRPEIETQGVPGGLAIKSGTLLLKVEYESQTPLM